MAADEEQNPFWRDPELRRRFFDLDERDGHGSPVLRRRRPRRCARRGSARVRGLPSRSARPRRRRARRRPAHRSHRRPRRSTRLSGAAPGTRRRADLGREDPAARARSCATGPSRGRPGYEYARDVQALFVDPAAEAGVHRADRRAAPVLGGGARRRSSSRCQGRFSPRSTACAAWSTSPTWSRRSPRCSSIARTSSPGPASSTTSTARRRPAARAGPPASAARAGGSPRVRDALPADDAAR